MSENGRGPVREGFRRWFLQPPRAHGEILEHRTVGFLELFYDLVYVVLIGQATHHLAGHVTLRAVAAFALVFTLIWVAWLNGSMFHELHGREDGRNRSLVFLQMGLLGVLGIYVPHATGADGVPFAITYALLLALVTSQWYAVRRIDNPEYRDLATPWVSFMAISTVLMAVSAALPSGPRIAIWVLLAALWVVGPTILMGRRRPESTPSGLRPTESMVERFDLFTIIVLGEVVVGVVTGLAATERGTPAIVTGLLALLIGFGFWWNYFDLVGGRLPLSRTASFAPWLYAHLVLTLGITAAGAGMVGLVGAAWAEAPHRASAWLLAGAVSLALLTLAALNLTLIPVRPLDQARGHVGTVLVVGAAAAAAVGLLVVASWLLAAGLAAVLSLTWFVGFALHLRLAETVG
jgi:low temperature requirement protein LtrA